ncbi:hypothetical protein, partial [Ralstonia pseudosolanacearum]|uniref:hypothetical protein n=1 Tax=Ralstonia pseudosolanacearum TaxID=1310165 RepID=UPI001E376D00
RPSGRQTTQSYPQRGRCITLSRGGSNLDENGGSNLAARQHAPTIAKAVSAYAAQLSLGASVAEYLNIPKFDEANGQMAAIGSIARDLTKRSGSVQPHDLSHLDLQVRALLEI